MIDFSLAYAALSRATDGGRRLAVPADHPDALLALGALSDALAASFPPPSTGGTEPNAKRRRLVVGSHQEREEGGEEEEAAADDNVGGGKDDAVDSLGVRQCDRVRSRRKKKTDATEDLIVAPSHREGGGFVVDAVVAKREEEEEEEEEEDPRTGADDPDLPIAAPTANLTAKEEESSPRRRTTKNTKIKGKCDICEHSDGFWGHNLQRCRVCGLTVHELCYGMPETTTKDPDFSCHACATVGRDVEVNVPSIIGGEADGKKKNERAAATRKTMRQERRPTECVLCSHDGGVHAMHPLLDVHGPEGRQLVWRGHRGGGKKRKRRSKGGEEWGDDGDGDGGEEGERLAWVHTLCAALICQHPRTRGCVYGCDKNGNYYGYDDEEEVEEEEEEEEEEVVAALGRENVDGVVVDEAEPAGSDFEEEKEEEEDEGGDDDDGGGPQDVTLHSYAISSEGAWAKIIEDSRKLKCFVCGKKDSSYRIPVQCVAGDDEEYVKWKARHPRGTECHVAMHVGCARWGCGEAEGSHLETIDHGTKRCKLCYYTPGRYSAAGGGDGDDDGGDEDGEVDTVAHCYCSAHAREIVLNNPNRKGKLGNITLAAVSERYSRVNPKKEWQQKKTRRSKNNKKTKLKEGKPKQAIAGPKKKTKKNIKEGKPKHVISSQRYRILTKAGKKRGKSGSGATSAPPTGAGGGGSATQNKSRVAFGNDNEVRFPCKGRSASVLAPPTVPSRAPPPAAAIPDAAPSSAPADVVVGVASATPDGTGAVRPPASGPPKGILRGILRKASHGLSPAALPTPASWVRGNDTGGILPDLTTSICGATRTASLGTCPAATNPANDSSSGLT